MLKEVIPLFFFSLSFLSREFRFRFVVAIQVVVRAVISHKRWIIIVFRSGFVVPCSEIKMYVFYILTGTRSPDVLRSAFPARVVNEEQGESEKTRENARNKK